MLHLISQSPRRFQILSDLKIPFQQMALKIEELPVKTLDDIVENATLKSMSIGKDLRQKSEVYLGVDTSVRAPHGEFLGKPKSHDDVRRHLSLLSEKTHQVYTGMCFSTRGCPHSGVVQSLR